MVGPSEHWAYTYKSYIPFNVLRNILRVQRSSWNEYFFWTNSDKNFNPISCNLVLSLKILVFLYTNI